MRDFRDAKTMAQTLRESLTGKAVNISHSESLELVSKMLGVADWNTLSALLQVDRRDAPVAGRSSAVASYPAFPLRDLVPFPTATYPLFVGREKTVLALKEAFERQRDVVLAVQRNGAVDEPRFEDIYEIGVLAQLLDVERLEDGRLKVLAQPRQRVVIRRFVGETGAFQADVADISEGPIPEAPELIRHAVKRFENWAAARDIRLPQIRPPLDQTRDPGRVADVISVYMVLRRTRRVPGAYGRLYRSRHRQGRGLGYAFPLPRRQNNALMQRHRNGKHMRRSLLILLLASAAFFAAGVSFAADLKIPPRSAPEDISVHKGPPNCSRWTDECVNCSRSAEGDAPVCSNIGFACQPKAVRCLSPVVPHSEPQKK